MGESLKSARIYIEHLRKLHQAASVLDVGCGRGMWLKACHEAGCTKLLGLDGRWNEQSLMADPAILFRAIDLDQPFTSERVDLAMSLEVAEHLKPASASSFVASLTGTSDTVLFGAAFLGQGGTNHINEQPCSYWATLFAAEGFDAFDIFRPALWGDSRIPFWYRQNTFLYARRGSDAHRLFGLPVRRDFMDCIHPEMYAARTATISAPSFKDHMRSLPSSLARAIMRRLG